ncbi:MULTISPECIES: glycoside hydrolase family 57 protein [Nitrosomonas]|uniref:Alpha-amylase/alpha-mannosidase (GH57 family) n=1 Tax=Nitrosomonas communis TaxID=44574 RepID=A0A0F7KAP6_9PROT|nr:MULTISPECIES: glycoside hydrolase family 57 protein [Nitrosomonas]AKH36626.1 glycoside hydrolase [Nitrosomonas communis]TYP91006.1 alpha-amylase/alpha-mannosidase (GH57 family) [Nitrosomonas communis]UVS61657.1 glycoside hydrolase family 57 protein [Nitrosomonas sp. PLL12]
MKPLNLVLLWHMHQPDYRDRDTGEFLLPWVYLHAIKDYTDMAHHLEQHPCVKAIVNFVPILLDQLEDYAQQFTQKKIRDPLLRLLATPDLNMITVNERASILNSCFQSNHATMLKPYPAYQHLREVYDMLKGQGDKDLIYVSGQYLADLLTWYHLAWMGESVRRSHEFVVKLMTQGKNFSYTDRLQLFNLIGKLIQELIPRYRELAASGQIELSTTPHFHPLAPLLIDFSSARDSLPEATLPSNTIYPGGCERVTFHVKSAINRHRQHFDTQPAGFWPAEGGISKDLLNIFMELGCQWSASGEGVLVNSLRKSYPNQSLPNRNHYLYRPYQVSDEKNGMFCFFRDDKLSDMIGFEYSKWFGRDAAENFIHTLEKIHHEVQAIVTYPIVSVILDGENAWESYPYNGYYFLKDLYDLLESHPFIQTTTYRDYIVNLVDTQAETKILPVLAAGSWVYGSFSTWIGDHDKNLAWDLLCTAKQSYDFVMKSDRLTDEEKLLVEQQLASCESSDWFWWFGDYNSAQAVASFDQLFRKNLANLYRLLKLPVPAIVLEPISQGGRYAGLVETMRRSS